VIKCCSNELHTKNLENDFDVQQLLSAEAKTLSMGTNDVQPITDDEGMRSLRTVLHLEDKNIMALASEVWPRPNLEDTWPWAGHDSHGVQLCMPQTSKFLTESTGKNCENWSIFSKDMDKVQ